MRTVMIVAGSDSAGGAGIQADIKAVSAMGCFPTTAIAALTAQNTLGVKGIFGVSAEFVVAQMDAIWEDLGADAVKTGMLFNEQVLLAVSERLETMGPPVLVVDPVMVSSSGHDLLEPSAMRAMKERLVPKAAVITPNLAEASRLTGRPVETEQDMVRAAEALLSLGPSCVLLKGGHLQGMAKDLLLNERELQWFEGPLLSSRNTHGTGCALASALAAGLALGMDLVDCVRRAKALVTEGILCGPALGRGVGPVDPMAILWKQREQHEILGALCEAAAELERLPVGCLIPEVQSNMVYAMKGAKQVEQVAGFPGRIVRLDEGVRIVSLPRFGASSHTARVVLAASAKKPSLRCCMMIRFSEEILAACRMTGLVLTSFDRGNELEEVRTREGASLPWGVEQALSGVETADAIFDRGGPGKEPVIRILGKDPGDVLRKVSLVLKRL